MEKKPTLESKEVVQAIGFDTEYFDTKKKIENWIYRKGFIFANTKKPIQKYDDKYRVRQVDPDKMLQSSYRESKIGVITYIIGKMKWIINYIEYLYYSASETVAFVIGLLLGSKFISPTKLKVRVSTWERIYYYLD